MDGLSEAWALHGRQVEGDTGARRAFAKLGLLPLDTTFPELGFPKEVKLATRLGAADRIVMLDPPLTGPFGNLVRELPIRHHLLPRNLTPEALPHVESHFPDRFTFSLGEASYRYSRVGLERLS
jgi:CRISPR-associated endonuclease/helicase Cas3